LIIFDVHICNKLFFLSLHIFLHLKKRQKNFCRLFFLGRQKKNLVGGIERNRDRERDTFNGEST